MSALEALIAAGGPALEALGTIAKSSNERRLLSEALRPLIASLENALSKVPLHFEQADVETFGRDLLALEALVLRLAQERGHQAHDLAVITALREFESEIKTVSYSTAFEALTKLRGMRVALQ
jgi:hypothetical protein